MSDPQRDKAAKAIFDAIVKFVADTIELYKPEWAERRETAKILVSLSSASLVFSITFSASIIKPWTPMSWRYSILVCWVSLVCSLASAIGSLWFSMRLSSLPALITISQEKVLGQIKAVMNNPNFGDLEAKTFIGEHTGKLAQEDWVARWLLRTSLALFGLALIMLTIVGVQQLLY